jgi:hypothetical protein
VEKKALWRVIMDSKYGNLWGGWCSNKVDWSYGAGLWKYIRRDKGSFLDILDLRWDTTRRLDFGMTCGVGIRPLRKLSQICIVLLALKMLPWQIT